MYVHSRVKLIKSAQLHLDRWPGHSRRWYCRTLSALAVAGFAGCTSSGDSDRPADTPPETARETESSETPTDTATPEPTPEQHPTTGSVSFPEGEPGQIHEITGSEDSATTPLAVEATDENGIETVTLLRDGERLESLTETARRAGSKLREIFTHGVTVHGGERLQSLRKAVFADE